MQGVARQRVKRSAPGQLGRGVVGDDRPAERIAQRRPARRARHRTGAAYGVADAHGAGVVRLHLHDDLGRHAAQFLVGFQERDHLAFLGREGLEQRADLLARRLALAGGFDQGCALFHVLADRRKGQADPLGVGGAGATATAKSAAGGTANPAARRWKTAGADAWPGARRSARRGRLALARGRRKHRILLSRRLPGGGGNATDCWPPEAVWPGTGGNCAAACESPAITSTHATAKTRQRGKRYGFI